MHFSMQGFTVSSEGALLAGRVHFIRTGYTAIRFSIVYSKLYGQWKEHYSIFIGLTEHCASKLNIIETEQLIQRDINID